MRQDGSCLTLFGLSLLCYACGSPLSIHQNIDMPFSVAEAKRPRLSDQEEDLGSEGSALGEPREADITAQPFTRLARLRMLENFQDCLILLTGPCAWKYSPLATVLQAPQVSLQGPQLNGQKSLCKTS